MDSNTSPSKVHLAARGNKGVNMIRVMFAEGNALNIPDKIISLGIGAPHLTASPLIDIAMKEFLNNKDLLFKEVQKLQEVHRDEEVELTRKKIVSMETYPPANGRPETQNVCAQLMNYWYPGLNATADHIIVTNGCTQSLMCVMHSLVEPGIDVCAFVPYFPPYASVTLAFGGNLITIPTTLCRPNKELFEKTLRENPSIGVFLLNDPVNPSGVKFNKQELLDIGEVLLKPEFRHIFILIDDTYHELCYGENPLHFLNVCGIENFKNRVAIAGCLSKCIGGEPGLRAGFLYGCDLIYEDRTVNIAKRSEVAMLNTSCGLSSIVAYSLQEVLKAKLKLGRTLSEQLAQESWERNATLVYSGLLDVLRSKFTADSHFPLVVNPEAAFFAMVSSFKLIGHPVPDTVVQKNGTTITGIRERVKSDILRTDLNVAMFLLHSAYVIVVPSSDFGVDPTLGYLRLACAVPVAVLEEAFERIEFVAKQVTGK